MTDDEIETPLFMNSFETHVVHSELDGLKKGSSANEI